MSPPSEYGRDVAFGARCLTGAFTVCARVQSSREMSASCVGSGDQIHDDGSLTPLAEIPQGCSSKFPTLWVGEG